MALMPNPAALSPVIAGTARLAEWGWTAQQRLGWIEANLDSGVTSFDHADIYGDYTVEALFGQALALKPSLRGQLQIISKCGIRRAGPATPLVQLTHYDTSSAHIRASVQQSLKALGTDHLDLLLIHRPDLLMDVDELADTFAALRRDGLVRHFGASNFSTSQLAPLQRRIGLATHQVELSPLHLGPLDDGTLDQCVDLGLRPMVWSPLAGGRVFTSPEPAAQRVRAVLQALSDETGLEPITLLVAWLRRHASQPLPILGSRRIEVAQQAMAALPVRLDAQQWYRLWTAAAGRSVA